MTEDPDMRMTVGRIDGRVEALEDRITRHENWVGEKMNKIDSKIDVLIAGQARSATIGSLFRWAAMLAGGASGWIAFVTGRNG